MAVKTKYLRRPTALIHFRDATGAGAGSTTLAAGAAAGATTITLTAGSNFQNGEPFRIGDGDDLERCDVQSGGGTTTLTLKAPLLRAHAAGEPVVELVGYDVGDTDGPVVVTHALESSDVTSGMRRLVYNIVPGFLTAMLEGRLLGLTVSNLCIVLGIPFTRIVGAGTAASPRVLTTDFNDVGTVTNACWALAYQLQDNSTKVTEFHGVDVDYTGLTIPLTRGNAAPLPFKVAAYGATSEADGAAPWAAPSLAHRAGRDAILAGLSRIGFWRAAGTPTTVDAAAAADAVTLTVADASDIGAEDWIAVAAGQSVETHWVLSKTGNVLTLKTPLLRAHAVGVAVTRVTRHTFASLTRGSASLAIGGSVTTDYSEARQLSVGMSAGDVKATFQFTVQELTLQARALALGIPESRIANGRLLTSEQLASAPVLAAFAEGVLKDNTTVLFNLWGCAQDLASVASSYASQGDAANTPFALRPSSGVQVLQFAA